MLKKLTSSIKEAASKNTDVLYEDIGRRIRLSRKAKSLSQDGLAEKMGKTASAISHYETGYRKISVADLREVSLIMDVSLDYLINGREEDQAPVEVFIALHSNDGDWVADIRSVIRYLNRVDNHEAESLARTLGSIVDNPAYFMLRSTNKQDLMDILDHIRLCIDSGIIGKKHMMFEASDFGAYEIAYEIAFKDWERDKHLLALIETIKAL